MSNAYAVGLLLAGGLALVLTAAVAAMLHGAIRFAVRTGRSDRKRLTHVALMRAWLGLVAASGTLFCLLLAWGAAEVYRAGVLARVTLASMPPLRMAFWTYFPWLFFAASAFLVAGRWCRPVFRSLWIVKTTKAYSRARLLRWRLLRLPPVVTARGLLRKYDRQLW